MLYRNLLLGNKNWSGLLPGPEQNCLDETKPEVLLELLPSPGSDQSRTSTVDLKDPELLLRRPEPELQQPNRSYNNPTGVTTTEPELQQPNRSYNNRTGVTTTGLDQ